jgi:hypothetical protein
MRTLVQLPAERDLQYLPPDYAGNAPERVESEVSVAERGVWIVCGRYLVGLFG